MTVRLGPEGRTDSTGTVKFDKADWDQAYYFDADGYVSVVVKKRWFRLRISPDPYDKSAEAKIDNGIILVPMKRQTRH
jgi:hypothetical protein